VVFRKSKSHVKTSSGPWRVQGPPRVAGLEDVLRSAEGVNTCMLNSRGFASWWIGNKRSISFRHVMVHREWHQKQYLEMSYPLRSSSYRPRGRLRSPIPFPVRHMHAVTYTHTHNIRNGYLHFSFSARRVYATCWLHVMTLPREDLCLLPVGRVVLWRTRDKLYCKYSTRCHFVTYVLTWRHRCT
jgi:hypothetical protein